MGCVILLWHSLGLPYNHFVILAFSRFGCEGVIWVLIAPDPGRCILVTLVIYGHGDHFVYVTKTIFYKFVAPS